jgi:hypothetical protein
VTYYLTIALIFNVIGVIFKIVAIGGAARKISYSFKKWTDEGHFKEEKHRRP